MNILRLLILGIMISGVLAISVVAIDCGASLPNLPEEYNGTVTYDSTVQTSQTVTATLSGNSFSNTSDSDGWYSLTIERCSNSSDTDITFTACGYDANATGSFTAGGASDTGPTRFDLSISTACSGDSSSSSSSGGGGGGGGGGGATPSTQTVSTGTIAAGSTKTFAVSKVIGGITDIVITMANTVTRSSIALSDVTSAPSVSTAAISLDLGRTYKYIEITTRNMANDAIEKAVLKFKVEKSWFTDKDLDPETVKLRRYEADTTWTDIPTTKTGGDSTYFYYEVELTGFSIYAIVAEKNAAAEAREEAPVEEEAPEEVTPTEPTAEAEEEPVVPQEVTPTNYTGWLIALIVLVIIVAIYVKVTKKKKVTIKPE